jgi:2-dehydropantoate 2-reductase
MHIDIIGAGAIGSVYGAKLSKYHDVTLVGGAAHVEAIRRDGLVMQGLLSETLHLPAFTRLSRLEPGTLILLTTKVNNNVAAIEPIVPLLPAGGHAGGVTILCVQNGLYSEELVKNLVNGRALVLRAITQVGGILVRPGVVDHTVAGYTLIEDHPQSPAIAAMLTAAGLDGRISPDIKKEMWRKAIFNCVINPTTSLIGCDVGGIVNPQLKTLKRQIIDECVAVARADGVSFDEDFVALIDRVFAGARTIASMRQDLLKGRHTEIDHMNGAVARLGEQYGLPCPVNAALTALIKYLESASCARL